MSSIVDSLKIVALRGGESALLQYLAALDENRVFSSENEASKEAIALANKLLNEASSRRTGLLLLRCLLGQLQSDLLQTNAVPWLQQAVKGMTQIDSPDTVIAAVDLLKILLPVSSKFPDSRKETSLSLIGKISESLYELRNNYTSVAFILDALLVVQEEYNKGLYSWKDRWEHFLLGLTEKNERVVYLAAKCYLGLACSGHSGTDHINFKNNWLNQFKNLSWYQHQILDKLIVNLPEVNQFSRGNHPPPTYNVPSVNENIPFVRISRLTSQFVGLSAFVKVMLLGKYPVSKRILPDLVFSVICRGLAITVHVLRSHVTSDTVPLLAQLSRLHTACLTTLEALIKSCRTNLLSYGPIICKLISQVLKSTQTEDGAYGQQKPYRSVRKSAYECLKTWLTAASCSSGIEKHPEIVEFIISDIYFKKPAVTLNLSSKTLKGKMGKKQRQALINQTMDSKGDFLFDVKANKEICGAALGAIPALLESSSSLVKPSLHKNLQTIICNRILAVQLNSKGNVPLPYSDQTCRLGLYESFTSLCLNYHPNFPPPLTYAARILENGLHDPCPEISRFCSLAMSSIDKMLRPIGPTLCLPIEIDETVDEKRVHFSDTNQFIDVRPEPITINLELNEPEKLPVEVSENPSAAVLAVHPLLEDVEMSEFDFLDQPPPDVESKYESVRVAEVNPVSAEDKNVGGIVDLPNVPECNVAEKRKISLTPVENLIKKSKVIENGPPRTSVAKTCSTQQEASMEARTGPINSLPSGSSIETPIAQESENTVIVAENELEEEMLSSFVDEVV